MEGYCNEMDERIIVYEHGFNRSLDKHLNDASFSWRKRLTLCMDVASVVDALNRDEIRLYKEIKSGSILVDSDWKGKISNLRLSLDDLTCKLGEPRNKILAVFLEILHGRLYRGLGYESYYETIQTIRLYDIERNLEKLVFEGTKEKIAPESLNLYINMFKLCFHRSLTPIKAIHHLKLAWGEQEYVEESPQISLEGIKLATHNFSDDKCIGEGRYWKLYEGEFPQYANNTSTNGYTTALVKRWDGKSSQGRQHFFRELRIPFRFKKKNDSNIVAVEGYCSEKDEKIIVFEHAYNRRLDQHLDDTSLTWTKRLNICINVASVLDLFHNLDTSGGGQKPMIHGDIKSCNSILIDGDWNAKVSNFEALVWDDESDMDENNFQEKGTNEDIYSFGVVLLELLCGRLLWPEGCEDHSGSLGTLVQIHYKEKGNFDELVFECIKEHISQESLIAYQEIAENCLLRRLLAREIVRQLKNVLELQEEYEMSNSKLPKEYIEYAQMLKTPEVRSFEVKKDLYTMLKRGILLQQGKRWFTLGANGERNEMISAATFAYKNRPLRRWRSIPESRFHKVAYMLDISNLKIQIRIKSQFLSPGINYGIYLVFKICRSRKSRAEKEYVNLSYKRGKDHLHAYFATWRDDEWMMIELCRFLNDKKDFDFEAILKSFSRCYCGSRIIYIEGIEFRSIDNVNYEEIEKSMDVQQVLKSLSNIDEVQQFTIECREISKIFGNDEGEKMFSVNEVDRKKLLRLSPMEILCDSSNMKPFDLNPSSVTRSQGVEFLRQQVFRIKCKIESQMLSPDTDYMCYLVFKLSERCNGLHGPMIIRDLLNWKNKETRILYFRSPSPWNLHNADWVPIQRIDGWMEVIVWKFNSKSNLRNDSVPMNLKLITYEGTMSGLMVCSLEIRPI